jgi:hypothetical protein
MVISKTPDAIQVRTYDCDGVHWILVVNRGKKPVKTSFMLPRKFKRMTLVAGKGVSSDGRNLAVDMQGLDYAFVKFDNQGGVVNGHQ